MKYKIILTLIIVLSFFLRVYQLDSNPPGFYTDEASYAYNAYSILKTGRDEHGVFLPITTEAFGDYKLPVMLYSIVASFAIFGSSEWAARLPGALYGIGTIVSVFFLVKELFTNKKNEIVALVAAAFIAISPAHIFVSRGTWELTPALFFITTATIAFLRALRQTRSTNFLYLLSAVLFIISVYAYNSARVFVPLFGVSLICIFWKSVQAHLKVKRNILSFAGIASIIFILSIPIIGSLSSPEVSQRAKYISIFYDKGVEARLFDAIRSDSGQPVKMTQLLHNKPVFYAMDYAKRYLAHFDFNFLFTTGDTFEIFYIPGTGFLPLLALPFIVAGIYVLAKTRSRLSWVMFAWLLISPIASAFTIFTPSLSRSQNMIVPLVIIAAVGAVYSFSYLNNRFKTINIPTLLIPIAIVIYLINTAYIFKQYFLVTPRLVAHKWNDGMRETVNFVSKREAHYDKIIVSSSQAPSYIFYAWYARIDPTIFQNDAIVDHTPDQNGLIFTSQIGKYYFTKEITGVQQSIEGEKILFVGFEKEIAEPQNRIYTRNGKIASELKDNL
ncbi:MAG: glycosyltransferase family 39 protein [bacterium]|nr:glycosyltransferase family 39 protein [bacterium]